MAALRRGAASFGGGAADQVPARGALGLRAQAAVEAGEPGGDHEDDVGQGEGHMAEEIRRVAEESGVPILQNVPLARGLNAKVEIDDYIGNDFFEAVAQVLSWWEKRQPFAAVQNRSQASS